MVIGRHRLPDNHGGRAEGFGHRLDDPLVGTITVQHALEDSRVIAFDCIRRALARMGLPSVMHVSNRAGISWASFPTIAPAMRQSPFANVMSLWVSPAMTSSSFAGTVTAYTVESSAEKMDALRAFNRLSIRRPRYSKG